MKTTKTVYNPNTGEDHLIDSRTGEKTVPEKTEEEKFQDFLLNLSEGSADNFIDKLEKLHIPKKKILQYLPEYYTAEQLAEDMYELNNLYERLNNLYDSLNTKLVNLRKDLENS